MSDIQKKIKLAKESIVLIDDYVDEMTINILEAKQENVKVFVYSKNRLMLQPRNIKRRKNFRAGFQFFESKCFKNMYLLIDSKLLFLLSRSIRYNSRRSFWFIQLLDIEDVKRFRHKLKECNDQAPVQYRHF